MFSAFSKLDDDFYDELEEALIMADLGVPTVEAVLDELRRRTKEEKISDPQEARQLLREIIADMMRPDTPFAPDSAETSILLVVGVNGVGKTTTIGKLAGYYAKAGKKVLLSAAVTFRAAAARAADGVERARERRHRETRRRRRPGGCGVRQHCRFEGAGREHAHHRHRLGRLRQQKKSHERARKKSAVWRAREWPEAVNEVLLVVDATTGKTPLRRPRCLAEAFPLRASC